MNKLLTDSIFRVDTPKGPARLSLPAVLAALGQDRVDSFLGLQRHQEDAFHIFLCYLAGAVLARAGRNDPGQEEDFWRKGLLGLAEGNENAWNLVVDDPTQPAFLQAPLSSAARFEKEFTRIQRTPDLLDLLLTAKSHDLKISRAIYGQADNWIFSLISLQTMAGYILQHQGIARMNSGFGSRPRISLLQTNRLSHHWKIEIKKLLEIREDLLRSPWPYSDNGVVLTWLPIWDRDKSLNLKTLDPFFIEISRGIRMVKSGESYVARTSTEKVPRIDAKALNGVLGDPWTPLNTEDKKKGLSSLTVSADGFTPKLLRDFVFGDGAFRLQAMQLPSGGSENQAYKLQASVLVRGQGTTDGFHYAEVPVSRRAAGALFRPSPQRDRLAGCSKESLARASDIQNKVLKTALYSLLEAGPEKINFDKREVTAWVNQAAERYAETWAKDFFPWLWRGLDQDDETARQAWLEHLSGLAWTVLQDAIDRLPIRTGRGYRSRVRAEGTFYGCLYHHFPALKKETAHDDRDHSSP